MRWRQVCTMHGGPSNNNQMVKRDGKSELFVVNMFLSEKQTSKCWRIGKVIVKCKQHSQKVNF